VTNIVNTLDTNIKLRRREIAMLQIGRADNRVGLLRMLSYESLFYRADRPAVWLAARDRLSVFIYYHSTG